MDEPLLWRTTPRKFYALLDCAMEYRQLTQGNKKSDNSVKDGTVDDLGW